MGWVRRAAAGAWDFVVGDDWRLALGSVVALGGAALLVAAGVDAWWFAPGAVPAILALSLKRALPG
jgi:hypothetical protein